jgi:hypothetical protein
MGMVRWESREILGDRELEAALRFFALFSIS